MKKLSGDLPSSPHAVVPSPATLNLVNFLIEGCSVLSFPAVMRIWKHVRESGVNPCWWMAFVKAICKLLVDMSSCVYRKIPSAFSMLFRLNESNESNESNPLHSIVVFRILNSHHLFWVFLFHLFDLDFECFSTQYL